MKSWNSMPKSLPRLLLGSALVLALPFIVTGCNNKPDSSEATSHISRAETYVDQGQYRSALLEVRNAIQADPNNIDHIVRLAELYLDIGADEQASELLEPWLEDHANAITLTLARAYVNQGKQLSATETLATFTPSSPEQQLEASLIRAEALRLSGEVPEALALFRNLSDSHSSNVEAIIGLARSHLDINQTGQAIEAVEEWVGSNGPHPAPLYWKGIAQYREDRLEIASETLTDAVAVIPTTDIFLPIRRNILTSLSRVLTELGKITEAQVYNRVLAENLNTGAQEQGNAVIAAIREGNIEEAKATLRDMLKLDPDNRQVALMLGTLYAGTGELEQGKKLLTENLDPETTPTQFIRAATMARIDTGAREEALETLDRAIKARPNDNDLLAMHGILALSLPDHEDAGIASLSKALSNSPERVRLRLALAQHHIRKGQPEQALGQLRMAFNANPPEWSTTSAYLRLLIEQGETNEAQEVRDVLLNEYSNEPGARLLASVADAQLGNVEVARDRLEALTADEPQFQAPKVMLAMLYNQSNQPDKAVATLVDAAKQTPEVIHPLQQAAQIYAQNHSVGEVEAWLREIGKGNADLQKNADVLIALLKVRQGDLADAREILVHWQNAESVPVNRAKGLLLQAEAGIAAQSGDYKTARAKAAEAIALQPDNILFAMMPAAIARNEGRLEDALSALDGVQATFGEQRPIVLARAALIRQKNGTSQAYNYLEEKWKETGDTGLMPALMDLTRAVAPDSLNELTSEWLSSAPDSMSAHMARADLLMANGQEIIAASHYEQVISRNPNNIAALNNLAWTLRKSNTERALELAGRARELAPESPAVLDTYGWILHLSGRHAEARKEIEKALDLAPDNADIKAHLNTVLKAL